jgi:hypothetical protein
MEKSWTLSKNLFNIKHFFWREEGVEQGFQILIFYFILIDQSISYLISIMI